MKRLGDFLKVARAKKGISQQKMSDGLGLGTKAILVFIENGQRPCPLKHIKATACAYGVSRKQIEEYNFSLQCLSLFRKSGRAYSEDLVLELMLLHGNRSSKA